MSVWRQERGIERAGTLGFLLYLPGLMMASTCCFMVTAGAVSLPFGPKRTISLSPSLFALFLTLLFFILSFALVFLSHFHLKSFTNLFSMPCLPPPLYSPPSSLWLIALMFFLWSTATSSSSELVWPHVFQEGMSRCGCEGPQGDRTAKHQNNMSHSCLMTSAIQPRRAQTVHLHPEGSFNMETIHLFHIDKYSYFIITWFPYTFMTKSATDTCCLWACLVIIATFPFLKNIPQSYILLSQHATLEILNVSCIQLWMMSHENTVELKLNYRPLHVPWFSFYIKLHWSIWRTDQYIRCTWKELLTVVKPRLQLFGSG